MVTQASDGGRIAPVSAHAAPPADHSAAARARALICGRARRRTPLGNAPRPYGWPDHKPSSLPRRSRLPRQRNARPNSARIQPTRALHRSRRAAFGRANAESVGQGQVSVLSDERQALFSLSSVWKSSVLLRRLILIRPAAAYLFRGVLSRQDDTQGVHCEGSPSSGPRARQVVDYGLRLETKGCPDP